MPTLSTLTFSKTNECVNVKVPFVGKIICKGTFQRPKDDIQGPAERSEDDWIVALSLTLVIDQKRCQYTFLPLVAAVVQRVTRNTWWPAPRVVDGDPITVIPGKQASLGFYISPSLFGPSTIAQMLKELADQLHEVAFDAALAAKDPEAMAAKASRNQADADMHFAITTN